MFSKSCKYAIRSVLYLAVHAEPGIKTGVKEIAERLDLPKHFLAKVLQQLSRNGLISSVKGPHGGFYLNDENLKATLEQIILAIDGPQVLYGCILGLSSCSSENPCPLHAQIVAYREGLYYQLKHRRIEDLAQRIRFDHLAI